MSLNMKSLSQVLAKTAAAIEKTVQTTVQEVTGPRPLQDYELLDQVGSGGPGLAWKLYAARPRPSAPSTQYSLVCVWFLDKRALSEARTRAGLSKATEDGFLNVIRADASRLVRIRHPGVVHVVQALDESKNAMAMVTEPLFASVSNTLGHMDNVSKVPSELSGMEMGLLEIKHGLLQIAESLDFLHSNARLIHRAISPENVFITSSGAWKLAGFGFAISIDEASSGMSSTQTFNYPEYDVEDFILPLQPSLNYTAPELVRSKSNTVESSADIFSFACLAYHLIARRPLLDCHNNVKMYMNSLSYISSEAFSPIPQELILDIQNMLSLKETSRPSAMEFTGSLFFRDDTRLRALRFLDHLLERDNMQKTDFLKALSDMWKEFDARILRYKVLPPLCAELRNMVLQPMILPMVLTIAKSQDKNDFELSTLPALVPVLNSASGETLLLLVKHADLIINKECDIPLTLGYALGSNIESSICLYLGRTDDKRVIKCQHTSSPLVNGASVETADKRATQEHLLSHVLPLLVRAYDDNDPRIQEEVLRRTIPLARQLETQLVKQVILPRVHGLALRTTVAAVRVNALRCLGDLVPSLDKQAVLDTLQTLQRCTAVDRSAPTLMCTLGVSDAIYKYYGLEFAAEHLLPLVLPLLITQQLSVQQFAKYMLFVKDILRKIEEKRGVTLTEFGASEASVSPSLSNETHSEPLSKLSGPVPAVKKTTSWDEDWSHINRGNVTASNPSASTSISKQSSTASQPMKGVTKTSQLSGPPVDLEWPPPNYSSSFVLQSVVDDNLKQNYGGSDGSFDDIDPFANWPPRQTSASIAPNSGFTNNSVSVGSKPYQTSMNSFPLGASSQASMSSSTGNADSLLFGLGYTKSAGVQATTQKPLGLQTSSVSTDGGLAAPKLAPPPSTTVSGKGRGRNQGNNHRHAQPRPSNHAKPSAEQPPLLDLL